MKFEMLDPSIIEPSPWNSNVVSHENEGKLRASIERHGMFKPLIVRVVNGAYQCIGGWHRCEQAIELGYAQVPVANLGDISDEKAKEISLADNARYGIDDTLKLSELLGDLDTSALEGVMPWTSRDIAAITASLSVDLADLDIPDHTLDDEDEDQDDEPVQTKAPKTHQVVRFRNTLDDSAKISALISETMRTHGFTQEDDLTNAGDALAFLLLRQGTPNA